MNRIVYSNAEHTQARMIIAATTEMRPVHDGPAELGEFRKIFDDDGVFVGFEEEEVAVPEKVFFTVVPPQAGDVAATWDRLIAEGVVPEPYVAPEAAAPAAISDRQFAHGLWKRGLITFAEALAFVQTGALPSALATIVGTLPTEIQDDVTLALAGATSYDITSPYVAPIAAGFGWSPEQTREFWVFAGSIQ